VENSIPPEYAPACSIESLAELQAPGTRRYEAGGRWQVAGGRWQVAGGRLRIVAEIMTSVNIIV